MKLRLIGNTDIDKKKWDELVDQAPVSFPWWKSWYLDLVSPVWQAVVAEDYRYVLPLPVRKKAGIKYVFPPDYTQQMGVFGQEIAPEQVVDALIEYAQQHFKYLELNLNYHNYLHATHGKQRKRTNHELLLSKSYPILAKRYHKNTRRNLKKAARYDLKLQTASHPENIIKLFQDNKGKQIKKGINAPLLQGLVEVGLKNKQVDMIEVVDDEGPIGGAIFFNQGHRKVFLFSGLSPAGRQKNAMFFLMDEVIKKYADSDVILDFEGSDDRNLATFYSRFGAEEKLYLQLKINQLPRLIRWMK